MTISDTISGMLSRPGATRVKGSDLPVSAIFGPDETSLATQFRNDLATLPERLKQTEAVAARNPDSDSAIFRQNGQIYAKVTRQGTVILNDNSFDVATFRQRLGASDSVSQAVKVLQAMLGKDYQLSYPGQDDTSRPSLQRQMDLLAINQNA